MAQGALDRSQANVAIANTGITEPMPDGPPAGTQCFAWVFRLPDGSLHPFSATRQFHGERNEIRAACADFALEQLVRLHGELQPATKQEEVQAERDILPELGLKRPDKSSGH